MSEIVLDRIKNKVRILINSNNELSVSNQHLSSEIQQLNSIIDQQKTEIEELGEKVKMLKMAKSLEGDTSGNRDMKLKINELVKEIDKCISLLNK